jgi:hypothetical protein
MFPFTYQWPLSTSPKCLLFENITLLLLPIFISNQTTETENIRKWNREGNNAQRKMSKWSIDGTYFRGSTLKKLLIMRIWLRRDKKRQVCCSKTVQGKVRSLAYAGRYRYCVCRSKAFSVSSQNWANNCKGRCLALNICSFVHQCNTFTFYFLLFVDMLRPHTAILRCYSILSRSWCSVMPIFAYVIVPAMFLRWWYAYCQCPFVRIFY